MQSKQRGIVTEGCQNLFEIVSYKGVRDGRIELRVKAKVPFGNFEMDLKTCTFESCGILASFKYKSVFMTGQSGESMEAMFKEWPSLN